MGAGFLVTERHLITCAHVVSNALDQVHDVPDLYHANIYLEFPLVAPGQKLIAHLAHWQSSDDVAGLELIGTLPFAAEPVPMAIAGDLWGHSFRAFGFPQGYDQGVWTSGIVREQQADGWIQIEDPRQTGYFISQGFSGTPIWDEQLDAVVGMVVAVDRQSKSRVGYIIPTKIFSGAWSVIASFPHEIKERSLSPFIVPIRTSYFAGRVNEIKHAEALLKNDLPIIIGLFGMGGVGKTALAIELCHRLREYFTDGVFFISAENLSLENIIDELAINLLGQEITELTSKEKSIKLRKNLANKKVLIIIDNIEDGNNLSKLIEILSSTKVVMTSRKRFSSGELHPILVEKLPSDAAVDLFINKIGFENPSETDLTRLAEICTLLGNLPLAIILLASRSVVIQESLMSMLTDLKKAGLEELSSPLGDEDTPSVRLCFDKSFATLNSQEQLLFTTLGAFGGNSFSLEAVIDCTQLDKCKEMLNRLVALSMVQMQIEERYSLHPLLRLYAQERIKDKSIWGKVAEYYLTLISKNPAIWENELASIFNAIDQFYVADKWGVEVGQRIIKGLVQNLGKTDAVGRSLITRVLAKIGGSAIDFLIQALYQNESLIVKSYVAETLGLINHPRALETLLKTLRDKNAVVQRSAINAVSKTRNPQAVRPLIEMLSSKHPDVRVAAKEALFQIRNFAIDPLIQALYHKNFIVSYHATQVLGEIHTPRAVPHLVNLLANQSDNPFRVLGESGRRSTTHINEALRNMGLIAIDALISLIEADSDRTTSENAMAALVAIGPKARIPLMLATSSTDSPPNFYLIKALEEIGIAKNIESIITCLSSKNLQTRFLAAKKLGSIASSEAVNALGRTLENDKSILVRIAAADALGELRIYEVIKPLVVSLKHSSSELRYHAIKALGKNLDFQEAVNAIIRSIHDRSYIVRCAVAESIGEIRSLDVTYDALALLIKDKYPLVRSLACDSMGNTGNPRCVKLLLYALNDKHSSVAFYAAEALGKIGDPDALSMLEDTAFTKNQRETSWGQSVAFAAAKACDLIRTRIAGNTSINY